MNWPAILVLLTKATTCWSPRVDGREVDRNYLLRDFETCWRVSWQAIGRTCAKWPEATQLDCVEEASKLIECVAVPCVEEPAAPSTTTTTQPKVEI